MKELSIPFDTIEFKFENNNVRIDYCYRGEILVTETKKFDPSDILFIKAKGTLTGTLGD